MTFFRAILTALLLLVLSTSVFAQKREIAMTIDDLPFIGEDTTFHLDMIINALKTREIPATGFVIASKVNPANMATLQKFRDAGFSLGNHTLTHANLARLSTEAWQHEIDAADRILSPLLTEPRYFRYPYLSMGNGEKKAKLQQHLAKLHYEIAPITIDSRDFVFNQLLMAVPEKQRRSFLDALRTCYLDFIWQQTLRAEEQNRLAKREKPQILLVHANLLNAYVLQDIIAMYQERGFEFVSLEKALGDAHPKEAARSKKRPHFLPGKTIANFLAWD